jgi:hypothetical protein
VKAAMASAKLGIAAFSLVNGFRRGTQPPTAPNPLPPATAPGERPGMPACAGTTDASSAAVMRRFSATPAPLNGDPVRPHRHHKPDPRPRNRHRHLELQRLPARDARRHQPRRPPPVPGVSVHELCEDHRRRPAGPVRQPYEPAGVRRCAKRRRNRNCDFPSTSGR